MKETSTIGTTKRIGTIALGIVIAFVLGFGQGDFFNGNIAKAETEQSTSDDESKEEVVIVQAVNAISTTVQLHVTHLLYFISENILTDGPKVDAGFFEKLSIDGYVNVIIRHIISPNAP
jgi:hypothetical protein